MSREAEGRLRAAGRGAFRGWEARARGEGRAGPGRLGLRGPRRADSRSPTSRIRTSFFMSAARRGRARPARMERTPLAGSAHPAAPLSQRCGYRLPASPAAPPDPRLGPAEPLLGCFPAWEPGQLQLRLLRLRGRRGRRGAARDKRFPNANALWA